MAGPALTNTSRRERQIMEVVYRLGRATASEIRGQLPDPPSYSAVRALLRILEKKGHLTHERDGLRYVFRATQPSTTLRKSVVRHMVETFFGGSVEEAMVALLDESQAALSDEELARIARLIRDARGKGR